MNQPPFKLQSDVLFSKTQEEQRKIDSNFTKIVQSEMAKHDGKRPKGDYTPNVNSRKKKRKAERAARKANRG